MTRKLYLLSLVATLALAFDASALTMVQTKYFGQAATFNQFDSGIGNLNSIRVDVTLSISGGQLNYDNDGLTAVSGMIEFGNAVNLEYTSDVSLFNSANQMIFDDGKMYAYKSSPFSLAADNGDGHNNFDSTAPDGGIIDGDDLTVSDYDYISAVYWNQGTKGYIGKGTYEIACSLIPWTIFTGSNTSEIQYYCAPSVLASGSITVTYSYDPVPEPAAISLLTAGIGLFKKNAIC